MIEAAMVTVAGFVTANGGGGAANTGGPYGNSSGSGGGGAGRIRLNSTGGNATITGTISPAITTTCFSQGSV